jgi:hypothetical protein
LYGVRVGTKGIRKERRVTTIYKVQIGDDDHYCDTEQHAGDLFTQYAGDGIPCRIWEQEWDDESDEPVTEDVIASNEEGY